MSKRLCRLLLTVVSAIMLLGLLTVGANAYTYPSMPSAAELKKLQVTVGSVTMPFDKYPSGSVYDDTGYMSVADGNKYGLSLKSPLYLRGWQCVGFARYAYAALFYKFAQDASIDTSLAYEYSTNYAYRNMIYETLGKKTLSGGYSAAQLRSVITACQPGAVMRCGGHSLVVMAIYDNGMVVYDANYDWANGVSVRSYTWQAFVNARGSKGIQALHMPAYYPGYKYSYTYNGVVSYPLTTSTAGTYQVYNCSKLVMHSEPTMASSNVGSIAKGKSVKVAGTYNNGSSTVWAKVTYDGVTGWVRMNYLRFPVKVTFDGNGAKSISFTSKTYAAGDAFTMPTVKKTNRTLLGWTDGTTTYTSKSTVPKVSTLQLKAKWCILKFKDVPDDAYYAKAVLWAAQNGITNGTSTVAFSPDANCTRAQIITFIWRTKGEPEPKKKKTTFVDIPATAYYYKAVLWASEQGIAAGIDATHFKPNQKCTRAQALTFVWRAAGSPKVTGVQNTFSDVTSSQYYYNAILWGIKNKVTTGTSTKKFKPDDACTRGQAVSFLYRGLK